MFLVLFVEYSSPSEDGEIDEEKPGLTVTRQPLRRADSDDEQLRHQLEEGEALYVQYDIRVQQPEPLK